MVRALDGLIKETEKIFRFFFLMVIMFQLCNFSLCYIVMYENCAILCSLIFIGGLYVWYYQCLRIYNRFKVSFNLFTIFILTYISYSISISNLNYIFQ